MKTQHSIDGMPDRAPAMGAAGREPGAGGAQDGRGPAAPARGAWRRRRTFGLAGAVASVVVAVALVCAGVASQASAPSPGAALLAQEGRAPAAAAGDAAGAGQAASDPASGEAALAPAAGSALLTQEGLLEAAAAAEDAAASQAATGSAFGDVAPALADADSSAASAQAAAGQAAPSAEDLPSCREGVVLVSPAEGVGAAELQAALEDVDAVADASVSDGELELGFAKIELADGADEEAALEAIGSLPEAAATQPDYYYYLEDEETSALGAASGLNFNRTDANDDSADNEADASASDYASFTTQGYGGYRYWTLNDPYYERQYRYLNPIYLKDGWDTLIDRISDSKKSGSGGLAEDETVTVAVLDTGCDMSHPDLLSLSDRAYDVIKKSSTVVDIAPHGHGTHVAGIIGATIDNHRGIAGVGLDKVKVLPINVFRYDTNNGSGPLKLYATTSDVCAGLNYLSKVAEEENVRVVNMSLGHGGSGTSPDDIALRKALRAVASKEVLCVCAAGNDGDCYGGVWPGDMMTDSRINGISVIALDDDRKRTSWSNYNKPGSRLRELSAPGVNILSTVPNASSRIAFSEGSGSSMASYGYLSGTSQAAPIVSGVAALASLASHLNGTLRAATGADHISAKGLKTILLSSATDLGPEGFDASTGWGEVNAYQAVHYATDEDNILDILGGSLKYVPVREDDDGYLPLPWTELSHAYVTGLKTLTYYYGIPLQQRGVMVSVYSTKTGKFRTLKQGEDYVLKYKNNVDATAKSGEKAVMIVEGCGSYKGAYKEFPFAIEPAPLGTGSDSSPGRWADNITTNAADLTKQELTYTGKPLTPGQGKFTAHVDYSVYRGFLLFNEQKQLSFGYYDDINAGSTTQNANAADYDCIVRYVDNTDAGQGKVYFQGTGNFKGVAVQTFDIKPADIASAKFAFTKANEKGEYTAAYTGKVIAPAMTGTWNGLDLKKGKDYKVSYENNRLPGTATVKIEGTGNFTGTKELTFEIASGADASPGIDDDDDEGSASLMNRADVVVSDYTYTGKKIEPKPSVKLGSAKLKKDKDYKLTYGNNTTVEDSEEGDAYVMITGIGTYKDYGSKTVRFKIKPVPISKAAFSGVKTVILEQGDKTEQDLTLKFNKKELEKYKDYDIEIFGNKGPGTAVVVVHGNGNFSGSNSKTYTVKSSKTKATNIIKATVSGITSQTYTGDYLTQDGLTVKLAKQVLIEGKDYKLEYWNNVEVGTASVCIYAVGSAYSGALVKTFKIVAPKGPDYNLKNATVEDIPECSFDGLSQKPALKVTLDGRQLKEGVDYTATYSNNVNVGTGKVALQGKGLYTGSTKATFEITASIEGAEISGLTDFVYNGKERRPKPTVKLAGTKLTTKCYTVSYSDNVNAGTATVIVTGKGGYKGTVTGTFTIKKAKNPMKLSVSKTSKIKLAKLTASSEDVAVATVKVTGAAGSYVAVGSSKKGEFIWGSRGVLYMEHTKSEDESSPIREGVNLTANAYLNHKKVKAGTYTMEVTAIAEGSENYEDAMITQEITVSVS